MAGFSIAPARPATTQRPRQWHTSAHQHPTTAKGRLLTAVTLLMAALIAGCAPAMVNGVTTPPDFTTAFQASAESCDVLGCVPDFRQGDSPKDVSPLRASVSILRAGDVDSDGHEDIVTYEPDQITW